MARHYIPQVAEAQGGGSSSDARVLTVSFDAGGMRFKDFRTAALACVESTFDDWIIPGPRSAPWVIKYLANHNGAVACDTKLSHEVKLAADHHDRFAHTFLCKIISILLTYDQLDCFNIAGFELLVRELQVIEERHKDRLGGGSHDTVDRRNEYEILMGTTMDASHCMMPALRQYLASEVGKQMMIDKERRKAREERELSRKTKASQRRQQGRRRGRERLDFFWQAEAWPTSTWRL